MIRPLALLLLVACGAPEAPTADAEPPCHDALPTELAAAPVADGPSLYELDLDLTTQRAEAVELSVHQGHPVLVSMFYATCPQACPMLIGKIQAIEAKLDPAFRDDVRVLLVSLDPERDDPTALSVLAARHDLDDRWTLARVPEAQVRELSAVLGVQYRALPSGDIHHSSIVTLLDREGRVVSRVDGLGADDAELVRALGGLADRT